MGFIGELFNLNKTIPLQKRGNLKYEAEYQTKLLNRKGFEILKTFESEESILLLYRHFYSDTPNVEETSIFLSLKVLTKKGVIYPEPVLKAFFTEDFTEIDLADIDIKEHLSNKGYGAILLRKLIDIAKGKSVSRISGWISSVDIGHIERLTHFYKKHGFEVIINEDVVSGNKIGDIVWTNK
jgi:GNAT superfamily N-acetyltransferase